MILFSTPLIMKRFYVTVLLCTIFLSCWWGDLCAVNEKPFIIPELQQWKGGKGDFVPSASMRIVVDANAPQFKKAAEALSSDYKEMFGTYLPVVDGGKTADGDIVFKKGKKTAATESYTLQIGSQIIITAPTEKGAYWATKTLLQMFDEGGEKHAIPQGYAEDNPDFQMRGFMLDVARLYTPMTYLRKLVKIMSYYKMNTLQIHLNDNLVMKDLSYYKKIATEHKDNTSHHGNNLNSNNWEKSLSGDWKQMYSAFRLECETYPGLTARDGSYTKQEFRDFQKMASDYGIEIIPEIDVPAHSLAFTQYDPTLGSEEFGMDHLNLRNPKVIPFLDKLWHEYLSGDNPVFSGKRVHIGTDEYSNEDPEVNEKFRSLIDHLIHHVESYGKQAIFWGSLTHAKGKTKVKTDNVILSMWYNGYADPHEMKEEGFRQFISIPDEWIYIVPRAGYCLDYLNTRFLYNQWTPNQIRQVEFDYDDPIILGGMFAVWNDIVGNGASLKDMHHRLFPAMQTLSAKFWTGRNVTVPYEDFDVFRKLVREAPGINENGKLANTPCLVLQKDEIKANTENVTGAVEIGYDYTISFMLESKKETKGTILLESPNSVFFLSDPVTGKFGYARDGYMYAFNYEPYPGEKSRITICGNNEETDLYVNGILKERKNGYVHYCDKERKYGVNVLETLVFPLQKTGNFKSNVTDFRVYNSFSHSGN